MDDVCAYRFSSALDVPSYAFGLRRRSPHTSSTDPPPHTHPHTALRTPATQGTHMSPMIYRLILRLTAPEEFEDKPADDEIE